MRPSNTELEGARKRALHSSKMPREARGFDVTCVVGRVTFDEGDIPANVAAFMLIAQHGAEGVFTFPREDGSVQRVTVEREDA